MRAMSINRALSELKLLKSRIDSVCDSMVVTLIGSTSTEKVGNETVEGFIQTETSKLQQYTDLVAEYRRAKAAIVASNAITDIEISGVTYTVANAIERKKTLDMEKTLAEKLMLKSVQGQRGLTAEMDKLQSRLETYLTTVLGGDKNSRSAEEVKNHTEYFMKRNTPKLIGIEGLDKIIAEKQKSYAEFVSEFDWALTDSNARTEITF